jgi:signal transduction histidine kinase
MSLPADFPACPAQRRRPPAGVRPDAGPDLRGVLHDVGHGLLTLSLLLDQVAHERRPRLGESAFELVEGEISRLLAIVHTETRSSADPVAIELHKLLRPFAVVSRRTTLTKVTVRPGPPTVVHTNPATLWRVVANLVDNAVRAAGPLGAVEIVVGHSGRDLATIDVIDDGPGFAQGPSGVAQVGLGVVVRLLDACGGRLQIHDVAPHGVRMRIVLPATPRPAPGAVERTDVLLPSVLRAS